MDCLDTILVHLFAAINFFIRTMLDRSISSPRLLASALEVEQQPDVPVDPARTSSTLSKALLALAAFVLFLSYLGSRLR